MTVLKTANKVLLGTSEASRVYLGSNQVWSKPTSLSYPSYNGYTSGSAISGNIFADGTMTITMPAGIQAGEILMVEIAMAISSTAPTPSIPGFTKLGETFTPSSSAGASIDLFYKVATGSESSVVLDNGSRANANMAYICRRIGNCKIPSSFSGNGYPTSGTFSITAPQKTTVNPGSIVHTIVGGRGTASQAFPVWGGGASGLTDVNTGAGNISFLSDANQLMGSPGTTQHTAQITNTQGAPVSIISSLILEPAA